MKKYTHSKGGGKWDPRMKGPDANYTPPKKGKASMADKKHGGMKKGY